MTSVFSSTTATSSCILSHLPYLVCTFSHCPAPFRITSVSCLFIPLAQSCDAVAHYLAASLHSLLPSRVGIWQFNSSWQCSKPILAERPDPRAGNLASSCTVTVDDTLRKLQLHCAVPHDGNTFVEWIRREKYPVSTILTSFGNILDTPHIRRTSGCTSNIPGMPSRSPSQTKHHLHLRHLAISMPSIIDFDARQHDPDHRWVPCQHHSSGSWSCTTKVDICSS